MNLKVELTKGAIMPKIGYDGDLGIDLCTPRDFAIQAHSSVTIDTGVKIQMPELPPHLTSWFNMGCFIHSKSGLSVKSNIEKGAGVVDPNYTGTLVIKLFCHGDKGRTFKQGDKIAQMVFKPCLKITSITEGDISRDSERGDKGFGSSGR